MKQGLKWAALSIAVLLVVYLVTPQDKIDGWQVSWLRVTGSPGIACLDYQRKQLKDPDSAKLTSTVTKDGNTTIRYKAANSYGAFVSGEAQCDVSYGVVNVELTEMQRANTISAARISEIQRENACLDRHVRLMWKGVPTIDAMAQVRQTEGCGDYRGPTP